jgi:hypothetical protein
MKLFKRTFALLAILSFLFSTQANSQVLLSLLFGDKLNSGKVEFGLNGGFNLSYLRGINESKAQNNWALGFYFDILLKEESPWYLGTGVYIKSNVGGTNVPLGTNGPLGSGYNRQINDSVFNGFVIANGTVEKQFNTFYVPMNLRYKFKNGFFIEGGPQAGLVFKTHDIYNAEVDGFKLTYDAKKGVRNNELYKWFDGGINGGIGYKSKGKTGWKLGVWYYVGLTNIYKNDLGPKAYNSSLYVLATIPIGKKKAERERAEKAAAAANSTNK